MRVIPHNGLHELINCSSNCDGVLAEQGHGNPAPQGIFMTGGAAAVWASRLQRRMAACGGSMTATVQCRIVFGSGPRGNADGSEVRSEISRIKERRRSEVARPDSVRLALFCCVTKSESSPRIVWMGVRWRTIVSEPNKYSMNASGCGFMLRRWPSDGGV